jgi:hypothetical protein
MQMDNPMMTIIILNGRRDRARDGDHLDGRPDLKKRDRLLQRLIAVHGEPRFDLFTWRK